MEKELDLESMKKLKKTVEKCIAELTEKDDLTPQETKAALDGMKLRRELCDELEDCMMKEDEEYSMRRSARRGSYGYSGEGWYRPMPMGYSGYPGYPAEHMNASYCDPRDPYYYEGGYSERRGRGYSRHSIGDRAVEKLENLMDQAGSEYEKEQLHKFIRMIRAAADEG